MIPPHELKNKEFTHVMRGYSIPEVDEYISFVMEKYTDLYRENDALERKLQSTMDALDVMRAEEESIRTALINAQKAGKQIVADASDRADKIMRSTKSDCMRVLSEFRDKAAAERKILLDLKNEVAALKEDLFEKYKKHIEYLEELSPNAGAEAAAMNAVDNNAFVGKIADSIADLIKEDFDFDINASDSSIKSPRTPTGEESGDTQVFAKVSAQNTPAIRHVTLDDFAAEASAQTTTPAAHTTPLAQNRQQTKAKQPSSKKANTEDADALFESLAAEVNENTLVTEEEMEAAFGIKANSTNSQGTADS